MPGISLSFGQNRLVDYNTRVIDTIESQNYIEGYTSKLILNKDNIVIGSNQYEQYPINILQVGDLLIIIEGKIYNKTQKLYENEILDIAINIDDYYAKGKLTDWLVNTDGDFIVFIHNRAKDVLYILNDIFGRLPLYFHVNNEKSILVSRYLHFISRVEESLKPDKMGIAQFMLLGYMLGTRTLLEQVSQLQPASFLKFSDGKIKIECIYQFNFDQREHRNKFPDENVSNISELFSLACNSRFNNNKLSVVTLSGGLDSRLIASCMYKNNIPYKAATLRYTYGSKVQDEKIAKQVAELFKVDLNVIELGPPKGEDLFTLLNLKEGMNSLFTSQLIPFYLKIKELFGSDINFITGDNGDRLIYSLNKPIKKLKSLEQLVSYIIKEHHLFDFDTVCKVCNVSKADMIDEIKNVLSTFPEYDLTQKYIHLRTIEKPHKYAFQGEDRHRHYFWTLSPFWSFPFYSYLMNCSDISKKKFGLFSKLIMRFSEEAIKIPYANFNASITSFKGKLYLFLIYNIYSLVPAGLKGDFKARFFGGNPNINEDSNLLKCIYDQMEDTPDVQKYIILKDKNEIKKLRKILLYNILTVTSAVEKFLVKNSTLKKYSDNEFI